MGGRKIKGREEGRQEEGKGRRMVVAHNSFSLLPPTPGLLPAEGHALLIVVPALATIQHSLPGRVPHCVGPSGDGNRRLIHLCEGGC